MKDSAWAIDSFGTATIGRLACGDADRFYILRPCGLVAGRCSAHELSQYRDSLSDSISVRDVGLQSTGCRRTFERGFKSGRKRSIYKKIIRAKLERAMLLKQTDRKIDDIADASGFQASVCPFQDFRRELSITPSAWRKEN